MLSSVLNTLHTSIHYIIMTTLCHRSYNYLYFRDEVTETKRVQVTCPQSQAGEIRIHSWWSQASLSALLNSPYLILPIRMSLMGMLRGMIRNQVGKVLLGRNCKRPCISRIRSMNNILNSLTGPGGTSGKEPTCQCKRFKRCGYDCWVGKMAWSRKWQPTPVFFPGKSHGQRSLVGYSLRGHKESDMTERLHFNFHFQRYSIRP